MTTATSPVAFAYETDPMLGTDQQLMVTMGVTHPFALWFPGRVQPVTDDLVRAPLHRLIGPLASTCARPQQGILESMATHRPSLDDLQRGCALLAKQITDSNGVISPTTVPAFRALCDLFLLPHVGKVTLDPLDLEHVPLAVGDGLLGPVLVPVEQSLLSSHIGPIIRGSKLLHAYGDLTELVGSHYVEGTKRGSAPGSAGALMTYVLGRADGMLDALKPNRPMSLQKRIQALHQFLQDSRCPPLLFPSADAPLDAEDEMYERTTIYLNSTRQAPGDDMVSLLRDKFPQVLQRPEASDLLLFLSKASASPGDDTEHFNSLRMLMQLTKGATRGVNDINSVAALERLIAFITGTKATWSSHRFEGIAEVKQLVNLLFEAVRKDQLEVDSKASPMGIASQALSTSAGDSGGRTFQGGGAKASERLLAALNDAAFTWVEDRLTAHQKGLPPPQYPDSQANARDMALLKNLNLPEWYRPIRDVMHGDSALAKRCMLGEIKHLPRECSVYISDLRRHFPSFFNLRLVWNEAEALTTQMLQFSAVDSVCNSFRKGNFEAGKKVNMLVQVWLQIRSQIRLATDRQDYSVERIAVLTDSRMLNKYKTLFDRALGAIGYPSVEQNGALVDSHAAAMDYLEDFLELGEPLSGQRLTNHHFFALQFLDSMEEEAAELFRHFLKSEDPAAPFPRSVLNLRGTPMLQLLERRTQLEKLMAISDYASELLSQAIPAGGSPPPAHCQLQNGPLRFITDSLPEPGSELLPGSVWHTVLMDCC